jgi:hypothetical protein
MRKAFFVLACVLISAGLFAETKLLEEFDRNTEEGRYFLSLYSAGKNLGRQTADELISKDRNKDHTVKTGIALSDVKWDLIRQTLGRYRHRSGDTYAVRLYSPNGNPADWFYIVFVAEYTSATQYTYWAWSAYDASGYPITPPTHFRSDLGNPDDSGLPPPDVDPPEW